MNTPFTKTFPVSWHELHRDCKALAWKLVTAGPWKGIIAITRGGLVPAAIVARELDVRLIDTVSIASYDHMTQHAGKIIKSTSPELIGDREQQKQWLIVDDLVDTGGTARLVRELIPGAHFATVYAKPAGKPMIDTYITEVSQDTWIMFPWDTEPQFSPPIASAKVPPSGG
jgi:xanthine phosphoribosyltransferase